jgi:malonyl-CoA/methylmalonyl-CoA synthetase
MSDNLFEILESRFPADAEATAFLLEDGTAISYGDMNAQAAQIANLLGDLGAQVGDRVAVQVEKTPEAVMLYLGCLRAGLIYLPLNTAYTLSEVEYFLGDATPAIVVCDPARLTDTKVKAAAAGAKVVLTLSDQGTGSLIDQAQGKSDTFETVAREKDDIAAILYTSGTTGRSKGAMLTHQNLASNALTLHKIWQWREGDVLLHALPIFHVHGLFVALHCIFLTGGMTIFLKKFDVDAVMKHLPQSTVLTGVPTFYTRLLANPNFGKEHCENMRLFMAGSAPLLDETFDEFRERTGHTILERYGMTETGMICSNPYDGDRIAGLVGPEMPDNVGRVADEEGVELPDGEIGVLEVKGVNVFKGYWKMPEKTRSEFRDDGYFITGDMSIREPNGYIRIVGRAKDLIISGGFNVYPKEIEACLDEHDDVLESAVVARQDVDFGEVAVAYVVKTSDGLTEQALRDYAREYLANFKVPKTIVFLEDLPRNTMGKVQKNQLRDRAAETA